MESRDAVSEYVDIIEDPSYVDIIEGWQKDARIAEMEVTIEGLKDESARLIDPEEDAHTLDTVMAKKYDEARWVAREAIANSFPVRPSDETIESEYAELVSDFLAERSET